MKLKLIIILSMISTIFFAQKKDEISIVRNKQLQLQNQENALDFKRLEEDLQGEKKTDRGPFNFGVYPYPVYDSISKNTFSGLGTAGNFFGIDLNGKKIVYTSFSENKSKINSFRVPEKNNMFFAIAVLTDYIDKEKYTSSKMQIVSRNFPDVIGQGYIKTKNDKIDFSAFITIENDQFAIVNMKLYNLKYGKIILIAPQKDGSLRSIQIKEKENLTNENLKIFLEQLIKKPEITEFFTNKNTI